MALTNDQVIVSIHIALEGLEYMESSRERSLAKTKLEEAMMWLKADNSE